MNYAHQHISFDSFCSVLGFVLRSFFISFNFPYMTNDRFTERRRIKSGTIKLCIQRNLPHALLTMINRNRKSFEYTKKHQKDYDYKLFVKLNYRFSFWLLVYFFFFRLVNDMRCTSTYIEEVFSAGLELSYTQSSLHFECKMAAVCEHHVFRRLQMAFCVCAR